MRWVAVGSFAVVALIASNDLSIGEGLDGAYYCVAEVSGGLSYDDSQKAWHGTSFKADEKFVLRMTFIDTKRYPVPLLDTDGKRCDGKQCPIQVDLNFDRYQAKITKTGTDKTVYCDDEQSIGVDPPKPRHKVSMSANGAVFRCTTGENEFIFNFVIKRFLMSYMLGYINSFAGAAIEVPPSLQDIEPSTPYVAGGSCTKIE